jgi:hypothetical protein
MRADLVEVAALFVRGDSVYKSMGVECWDAARDARGYVGPGPVICHPPCRTWGVLRHWRGAKDRPEEKALGPLAVGFVRAFGGVLEHPYQSALWRHCGMPQPGLVGSLSSETNLPVRGGLRAVGGPGHASAVTPGCRSHVGPRAGGS